MTSLFPPRESLVVTSRLGTGNSRTFFLRCMLSHLIISFFLPKSLLYQLSVLKFKLFSLGGLPVENMASGQKTRLTITCWKNLLDRLLLYKHPCCVGGIYTHGYNSVFAWECTYSLIRYGENIWLSSSVCYKRTQPPPPPTPDWRNPTGGCSLSKISLVQCLLKNSVEVHYCITCSV